MKKAAPENCKETRIVEFYLADPVTKQPLDLYSSKVSAGFPSPAESFVERKLDLNSYLVRHPAATFFVRVSGESMLNAGIQDGDMLLVDKSLQPTDKKVVIASVNGELTVKRIRTLGSAVFLVPENEQYAPIKITEEVDFSVWGVVTTVIHSV
jgi:DNA polymerase V